MAARVSLLFAVAALFWADGSFARKAAPKKPIMPGETGSVTLMVGGTTQPVRVHVVNKTPQVVTVVGGDDQIVMSSGGAKNGVTLQLTGVSPGEPSFSLEVDHTDLDTLFQQTLRKVAQETRRRMARLETMRTASGRAAYQLKDVLAVLQHIESDLDEALPDRELAAFRDAIRDYVAELQARAVRMAAEAPAPDVARIAFRPAANRSGVDKEKADALAGEAAKTLDDNAERGLQRRLCVLTAPTGYEITLYPRSYPPDAQTVTAASPLTLNVGKYRHRIRGQQRNQNLESNGDVDLLRNPYPAIKCPVRFQNGDPQACGYVSEWSGCP